MTSKQNIHPTVHLTYNFAVREECRKQVCNLVTPNHLPMRAISTALLQLNAPLCVSQDKELLAGRSALLAAQRAVSERSAAISQAKQELWEAKRKTAHQSALLDAIAHDIAHVSCTSSLPSGQPAAGPNGSQPQVGRNKQASCLADIQTMGGCTPFKALSGHE